MSQPTWKLVYATDYSALYTDETGVYPPELVIAQTDDDADTDDIAATVAYVYRFPLDRLYQTEETDDDDGSTITCLASKHGHQEWFQTCHGGLGDIARSCGYEVADLVKMLCSEDPSDLACAYEAIGGYHGFDNLDSYPQEWTEHEFAQWPDRGPRLDPQEREAFTRGYVECALWCGVMAYKHAEDCAFDPDAATLDPDSCTCDPELTSSEDAHEENELTTEAHETLTSEAHAFYADHVVDLRASKLTMERAGHDFWLTRNRHGAGFWDDKGSDPTINAALDRLTEASHAEGSQDLYLDPATGEIRIG